MAKSKWTQTEVKKFCKTNGFELSKESIEELTKKLKSRNANDKFAKKLGSYYHKKDNNEEGGKVTATQSTESITGVVLSKTPRRIGKLYEAENIYLFVTKPKGYPETTDRDGNVCPAGRLEFGTILELQSWTPKKNLNKNFDDQIVGKELTFNGKFGSYKGGLQFNTFKADDSEMKDYEDTIKGEPINKAALTLDDLLDADEKQYKPVLAPVTVTSISGGHIWEDGEQIDQDFPYFTINGHMPGRENIRVQLTFQAASEGEKDTLGLEWLPLDHRQDHEDAKEEDDPFFYLEAMLEQMTILAGFVFNQTKPYDDNYTVYGDLFGTYDFVNTKTQQTKFDEAFIPDDEEDLDLDLEDDDLELDLDDDLEEGELGFINLFDYANPVNGPDDEQTLRDFFSDGLYAELGAIIVPMMKEITNLKSMARAIKEIPAGVGELKETIKFLHKLGYIVQVSKGEFILLDYAGGDGKKAPVPVDEEGEVTKDLQNWMKATAEEFVGVFDIDQIVELVKANHVESEGGTLELPDTQIKSILKDLFPDLEE